MVTWEDGAQPSPSSACWVGPGPTKHGPGQARPGQARPAGQARLSFSGMATGWAGHI